jgi:hypothetical protein
MHKSHEVQDSPPDLLFYVIKKKTKNKKKKQVPSRDFSLLKETSKIINSCSLLRPKSDLMELCDTFNFCNPAGKCESDSGIRLRKKKKRKEQKQKQNTYTHLSYYEIGLHYAGA